MTLEEAIIHAKERANKDCSDCAKDHQQLAAWLIELRGLRRFKINMATIEERAECFKLKVLAQASIDDCEVLAPNAYSYGYKVGAEEQQRIDIDKALVAYCACCSCGCEFKPNRCGKLKDYKNKLLRL